MSDKGHTAKTPFRPKFDPETEGMLADYCEALGEANMTAATLKAVREYVLKNVGRNEGVRERFTELQYARFKQRDGGVASTLSTGAKPDELPPRE